jgi:hypothetical protein
MVEKRRHQMAIVMAAAPMPEQVAVGPVIDEI